MKYDLKLSNNEGFRWEENHGIHIRGYFYINGKYAESHDVFSCFAGIHTKSDFLAKVRLLNGCFSVIAEIDGSLFAASDLQRSFPIFYAVKNNVLFIRDEVGEIINATGYNKINRTALIDYLHFECVIYNMTLVEGISQIQAMHFIYLENMSDKPEFGKYMTIYETEYSVFDKKTAETILDSAFSNASARLADSLKGRTAVVSLSGGIDSRACLMMLKNAGYTNVVCYTYGWKGNPDVKVAENVARLMGFRHVYIPYDRKLWRKAYKDEYTLKFIKKSNNLTSIAHMESHFVVRKLMEERIVPKDSVFMTGHVGVMAKSFFGDDRQYTKEELTETFWKYYAKLYSFIGKRKRYYIKRLSGYIGDKDSYSRKEAEIAFENAGYEMCRGNHLINSHRQFELNGCEWRVPLMDHEILNSFMSMATNIRDNKKKFFTDYIIRRTGENVKEAVYKKSLVAKAYKNIRNPVYSIMRPIKMITLGYKGCMLPPFPIRQYRFMRRFYSYCALSEIRMIKDWYGLED